MKIYADTSALIAWFNPADEFASAVTSWCSSHAPDFYWNPLLRIELRHHLRRLTGKYAAVAWHAYRASESSRRLKLGTHRAADLLEWGDELSARHSSSSAAGTWDFVHVAVAQHVGADMFITCDIAQAELAHATALPVQLFR